MKHRIALTATVRIRTGTGYVLLTPILWRTGEAWVINHLTKKGPSSVHIVTTLSTEGRAVLAKRIREKYIVSRTKELKHGGKRKAT